MNDKKKVYSSLNWKFLERVLSQGIQLIIQIVLARLLLPEDFGILSILLIFINFSNIFIQGGLNIALVQKQDADDLDFSTIFWTSYIISLILYVGLFILSPIIANYYDAPVIKNSLRIIGLTLLLGPLNTIFNAVVIKNMLFKTQFYATLIGNIVYGLFGTVLALSNYGIWALVIAHLSSIIFSTIILLFSLKVKILFSFSIERIKNLFSFSWKMLMSSILYMSSDSLYGLFIGKKYSKETLAYYNKANKFPLITSSTINTTISSVILPVLTEKQKDNDFIIKILYQSTRRSTYILTPLLLGMSAISGPLIILLLTDKWSFAIPLMQIISIEYSISSIHTTSIQAYAATGNSQLVLKIELLRLILFIISLFIGFKINLYYIFYFRLITSVIISLYIIYINKRIFNYSFRLQFKSIIPNFLLSATMFIIVLSLNNILEFSILNTFIVVVTGVIIYIGLSNITKNEDFLFFTNELKVFLRNRKVKNDD